MNQATKPGFYQPELDALRFCAFLMVFVHHKTGLNEFLKFVPHIPYARAMFIVFHVSGAYGVSLFFLLSSYLITRLLRKEVAATGRLHLKAFYYRRALRIWPLYFFFLALCWALSHSTVAQPIPGGFYLAALGFISNWYLVFHGYVWLPAVVVWTIGIEEQFYLLWPWLVRRAQHSRLLMIAGCTFLLTQGTLLYLRHIGATGDWQISFNTFTQLQFFGAGALMALWAEERPLSSLSTATRALLVLGGFAAFFAAAPFDHRAQLLSAGAFTYNVASVFTMLGALLIFRAFLGAPAAWFPKWILFLGKISFGLYLFNFLTIFLARIALRGHVPILAEVPLTLLLNIAAAVVSWFLIERPFLRLKSKFEIVKTRPIEG